MFGIPLHLFIIHFPIALTVVAAAYDSWALYARKPILHRASYGMTLWASAAALAAVGTGLQLAQSAGIDKGAVTGHAGFAIVSTIVLVGVGGMRYSAQARERKEYQIWWLALEIAAAGLILATAVTGHRL